MATRTPHVDPETLYLYATGETVGTDRDAIARHLDACGACRAELDLARRFAEVPADTDLGERSERLRGGFRSRLGAASGPPLAARRPGRRLAAGLLLAASLGLFAVSAYLLIPREKTGQLGDLYRNPDAAPRIAGEVLDSPEGWTISWNLPATWGEPGPGTTIVLRVLDPAGRVLLERIGVSSPLTIRREEIPAGTETLLFARLTAASDAGETISSEPLPLHLDR